MLCKWDTEDGPRTCLVCGFRHAEPIVGPFHRSCGQPVEAPPMPPKPKVKGPGDFLHAAILKWTGETPSGGCSCRNKISLMNAWGPSECRARIKEIVEWLREAANSRGWWKYAVAVPGSRYFIERMVLSAIRQAEAAAKEAVRTLTDR
jgi:hypothetical protein